MERRFEGQAALATGAPGQIPATVACGRRLRRGRGTARAGAR